jgi:hypothetical protein
MIMGRKSVLVEGTVVGLAGAAAVANLVSALRFG